MWVALDYIGAHRTIWPGNLSKATPGELSSREEMLHLHQFLQLSAPASCMKKLTGDKPAGSDARLPLPQDAFLEAAQKAGLRPVKNVF